MKRGLLLLAFSVLISYSLSASSFDMALHPVETAKKAVIGVGVAFVAKKTGDAVYGEFQKYMKQNPYLAEEYLQNKIEFADKFFRYIDKHKSGVSAKEFDILDKNIREGAVAIDRAVNNQRREKRENCSPQDLEKLLLSPSVFDDNVNISLPHINGANESLLAFGDVDSYYVTTKKKTKTLQRDHIPSFGAIKLFLQNHNINTDGKNEGIIQKNTSTIAIDTDIHEKTQTYGGRNTKTRQKIDAQNLKLASIRNMVFAAALTYKKYGSSQLSTYIFSGLTLYERNSLLCLYQ